MKDPGPKALRAIGCVDLGVTAVACAVATVVAGLALATGHSDTAGWAAGVAVVTLAYVALMGLLTRRR